MPCKDVTERIRVAFDTEDKLQDYQLVKRSCGKEIGTSALLLDQLTGLNPEAILSLEESTEADTDFLTQKHLSAVKSATAVLVGQASGDPSADCRAARIHWDEGNTVIEAFIRVKLDTSGITPCNSCCG